MAVKYVKDFSFPADFGFRTGKVAVSQHQRAMPQPPKTPNPAKQQPMGEAKVAMNSHLSMGNQTALMKREKTDKVSRDGKYAKGGKFPEEKSSMSEGAREENSRPGALETANGPDRRGLKKALRSDELTSEMKEEKSAEKFQKAHGVDKFARGGPKKMRTRMRMPATAKPTGQMPMGKPPAMAMSPGMSGPTMGDEEPGGMSGIPQMHKGGKMKKMKAKGC